MLASISLRRISVRVFTPFPRLRMCLVVKLVVQLLLLDPTSRNCPSATDAYLSPNTFAQYTKVSASNLKFVKLPSSSNDEDLKIYGSLFLQGLTALTFVNEAYNVKSDDFVLVWAAAGGVGRLIVQLAAQRGAHVIAVASTDEKLQIAKSLGAEYLVNSSSDDVAQKEWEKITQRQRVSQYLLTPVGKDTFETSLSALARKGHFVSYGNSSGTVTPFPLSRLSPKNIQLARPQLFGYITEKQEWDHYAEELKKLYQLGELKFEVLKVYELKDYQQAAEDLEGRKTTGKLTLKIPE
ncbi:hypothetical protein LELG_02448 [Lodderomyces elongisporus NRRL YB-4239]|uniref:Enoyl reductase (ER) domain-containing protein n=1 Tax=Lodderomyces elongisporus (strain ATCC 11503 / CBS 2605 / JCM 1781 / NBRC 1676 / NRRL YB-4239) TaxID=379508 RepID=A5DYL1_LODEL|nr:hypothetical protein LELG_02448 [Lodderomyces elongisporus NRRL YB-4239]